MRSAKHSEIRVTKLRIPVSEMSLKVRKSKAAVGQCPNCGVPLGLLVTGFHEQLSQPPQAKLSHVILFCESPIKSAVP